MLVRLALLTQRTTTRRRTWGRLIFSHNDTAKDPRRHYVSGPQDQERSSDTEGRSYRFIAKGLDLSVNTIRGIIHRHGVLD